MKKMIILAVMAGIAHPAFAGGQFDLPATGAADLRTISAELPAPGPARAADRSKAQDGSEKVKLGIVSKAERNEYIIRASLWRPEESLNVAAADFKVGPFEKMKYAPDELVTCSYVPMKEAYETGRPNGMSPKFKCRDAKGKDFKVKYGETGDVMAEVASSWILTAIGAYADRMYPVRLNCPDCPSDPFKSEKDRGAWRQGQMVAIEDKIGERIEFEPNSGIGFDEFYRITDQVGAEALNGMAQFLSNSDNKAPNQAIACQKRDTVADPATGKANCLTPVVYLQDMGISFGGRGWYHNSRMNFDKWAKEKIWDDPRTCVMHLNATHTSSISGTDPIGRDLHQIGEKARQMMIRRLGMLSRAQLIDIFTAARAPKREPYHTSEEWADLFLSKVETLRSPRGAKTPPGFACPYQIVPPNSAPRPESFIN
ncbi:MAG: hypothetical protein Q7R35_06510 [Elusimicrobiota bacterium]|nr:hypothetical protein [Elusimicrobiota bacterium]